MNKIFKFSFVIILMLGAIFYISYSYSDSVSLDIMKDESKLEDSNEVNPNNLEDVPIEISKKEGDLIVTNQSKEEDNIDIEARQELSILTSNKNEPNDELYVENDTTEFTQYENKETDVNNDSPRDNFAEDTQENIIEDEIIIESESNASYYEDIYTVEQLKLLRNDRQNEVTVDLIFLNNIIEDDKLKKDYLLFYVYMDTHTYEISEENLKERLMLQMIRVLK